MFSFCISEKHQVRGLGAGLQDPQQLVLTCLAWAEDLFSGQRGGSPVCDSFQGEANGFIWIYTLNGNVPRRPGNNQVVGVVLQVRLVRVNLQKLIFNLWKKKKKNILGSWTIYWLVAGFRKLYFYVVFYKLLLLYFCAPFDKNTRSYLVCHLREYLNWTWKKDPNTNRMDFYSSVWKMCGKITE